MQLDQVLPSNQGNTPPNVLNLHCPNQHHLPNLLTLLYQGPAKGRKCIKLQLKKSFEIIMFAEHILKQIH